MIIMMICVINYLLAYLLLYIYLFILIILTSSATNFCVFLVECIADNHAEQEEEQ
jgi:hypothetical protein